MPSHMEGLGTSVLDAMAAGAPVVGTAAGGMPEAIEHEVTGLVCPIKDAPALATAILRVLNDPALAAKFRQNGQARVRERFSTDAMVDGTVKAYARITHEAPAPRAQTVKRDKPKVGRNDPCWCGSGKKYKNCHLRADEEAQASSG